MPIDVIRTEDPHLVIDFAMKQKMIDKPGFEWIQTFLDADNEHLAVIQAFNAERTDGKQFKFGVEVPKNPAHALLLDKKNGNTHWKDSIKKELDQIHEFQVFKIVPDGQPMPRGYKESLITSSMMSSLMEDSKADWLLEDTEVQCLTKKKGSQLL